MDALVDELEARVEEFFTKVSHGLDNMYAADAAKDDVVVILNLLAEIEKGGNHFVTSFALEDQGKSLEAIEAEVPEQMQELSKCLAAISAAEQVSARAFRGMAPVAKKD